MVALMRLLLSSVGLITTGVGSFSSLVTGSRLQNDPVASQLH